MVSQWWQNFVPRINIHPKDVDSQNITPRWPPNPSQLAVAGGVYELVAVPLSSISFVTSRTLKVRPCAPHSMLKSSDPVRLT